ncbi:MAG: hydroxyethylthiazole kinase [Clostridia bacterium]|nr:hydroxyethylthiazole kinase [Clostridia bacterium]
MNKLNEIRAAVRKKQPLIHCITNPISINQCANAILAIGARPIMAEHPAEVREITETADALMLNLGNITDVRMKSMEISLRTAKEKNIPVILDAVGVACSGLRRDYLAGLLETGVPTVIKGNYSEIYAMHHAAYRSSGVDADAAIDGETIGHAAAELARKYGTIILASGKTDVAADGERIMYVRNGTPQLSSVTGTGCMLGALCGGYLSVCRDIHAAATACAVLGVCGQLAGTEKGSGSFMVNLMDALSTLTDAQLGQYMKIEEMTYEKP